MEVKILIVEDEALHRRNLVFLLSALGYNVCGEATNASEAYDLFFKEKPDLVIIDINIEGDVDGIGLARALRDEHETPIIFLTSIKAKEIIEEAVLTFPTAYLNKPITEAELSAAILLAVQKNALGEEKEAVESHPNAFLEDSFFVKIGKALRRVNQSEVLFIQSSGDKYSDITCLDKRQFSVRNSLSRLEESIDSQRFIRVHRAYIINIEHIDEVLESDMEIKLSGFVIPIGRSYKSLLMSRINMIG